MSSWPPWDNRGRLCGRLVVGRHNPGELPPLLPGVTLTLLVPQPFPHSADPGTLPPSLACSVQRERRFRLYPWPAEWHVARVVQPSVYCWRNVLRVLPAGEGFRGEGLVGTKGLGLAAQRTTLAAHITPAASRRGTALRSFAIPTCPLAEPPPRCPHPLTEPPIHSLTPSYPLTHPAPQTNSKTMPQTFTYINIETCGALDPYNEAGPDESNVALYNNHGNLECAPQPT